MRKRPLAQCRLCLETHLLCDSHLLPAAVYRLVSDRGPKGLQPPIQFGKNVRFSSSRQIKDYLLCENCEAAIRVGGEDWVLSNCYQSDATFPIRDAMLRQKASALSSAGTSLYKIDAIAEIDLNKVAYFALSIFWRVAVHKWRIGKREVNIRLGTYTEALRGFLRGEAFPKDACLVVRIAASDFTARRFSEPHSHTASGFHAHLFNMAGLDVVLLLGKRIPLSHAATSAIPGGYVAMNATLDQEELQRFQLDLMEWNY